MKIRTQFIITMLLFGIILLVIALSAIGTSERVEKAGERERIASSVAQGANELSYLANDYLIYRESPQLNRWQSRFQSFSAQVAGLDADRPEQQALVRNIRANQLRLKEVFDSVVSGVEASFPNRKVAVAPAVLQISWSRMAVQSQGLVSDATRLSQMLHQEMDRLRETQTRLIYVMVGVFGALLLAGYVLTYRRVLKSIATLRDGTAIVGSGNLDFEVDEKANDEIGDLAKAFNRMTADLKTVTASKADLEREVTERKRAEEALKESEHRVRSKLDAILLPEGDIGTLDLADMIDAAGIQALMEDFYKLAKIPMSILDLQGKMLVGVGWQTICTKFHRVHPETCGHCLESDTKLSADLKPGEIRLYKCRNHMWDIATPIFIGGKHVGNLFSGQFVFEGESPDYELFRERARRYGFDEARYIAALKAVPRLTRETIDTGMAFFTKLTQMLSQLSYSNIRLARLLSERDRLSESLQKAHDELQDHAGKLEETNKELEGFAYTISHDLRAPLRAINGFAHMLADDYGHSLEEEGRRRLGIIEANAVKMGLLIDDLLAFSRAGRTAMNVSRIDVNRIVAEVLETLKTSEDGAKAALHVAALPPAHGDPALIRQVLANLLGNAVKFSQNRPDPRIEVGSFERDGEGVYFVKDNGVGFDMKYKEKLFGVFQRLVTEKEFEGTGVGLAIVHRLVTRHGGRVWAEARPGEGATFFFTLGHKDPSGALGSLGDMTESTEPI